MKLRLAEGLNGGLAALGLLLTMPALYFVSANVLKYELNALPGLRVLPIHPAVLLGGLVLAGMMNLWPLLHVAARRIDDLLTIIITLRLRLWNLVSLGLAVATLGTLLIYAVVENIGPICAELLGVKLVGGRC
jgi:hypothetical protein